LAWGDSCWGMIRGLLLFKGVTLNKKISTNFVQSLWNTFWWCKYALGQAIRLRDVSTDLHNPKSTLLKHFLLNCGSSYPRAWLYLKKFAQAQPIPSPPSPLKASVVGHSTQAAELE
jgi:hypothetical protein